MNWRNDLRIQGYAQFARLIPEELTVAAADAIQHDLRTNYDPGQQAIYDNQSYCPAITSSPQIMNLLVASPVYGVIDEVLGVENIAWNPAQIAIRTARNHPVPITPEPHIDGFASGRNGVPKGNIYNHTALVGIFLTAVRAEFSGNFTVWPGSHYTYERYFRDRGKRARNEPMPELELGRFAQLTCEPGDVVLAHYQLGHTAAVNTSDRDRVAVYFRIFLRAVELDRWRYLTNIWDGWRLEPLLT